MGSESFVASAGTAILVPEGVPHRMESSGAVPLRVIAYRWAPGGDRSALHAPSTMTDPVSVPELEPRRDFVLRHYQPTIERGARLRVHIDDVDWTTNWTYSEALWNVYRYKPLVGEPLADWPGVARDDVRAGIQELEPGAAYPGHHHPSPEIYYVLSGVARWTVGEEAFSAPAGTAIFTPPDTRHRIDNVGTERLRWLYLWWAPGGDPSAFE